MSKENSYLYALLAAFAAAAIALFGLFNKFAEPTLSHFIQVCRQTISSIPASAVHFTGFGLIWLVSLTSFLFFAKSLFSLAKSRKKINTLLRSSEDRKPKKLLRVLKKHGLNPDNLAIVKAGKVNAISYGFIKPKLLLSRKLVASLSEKELEAVILHELAHISSRHSAKFLLGEIISTTLFFLPVLKDLTQRLRLAAEQEADRYVLLSQGESRHLKSALAKAVVEEQDFYPQLSSLALETRINTLLGKGRRSIKVSKLRLFLSLLSIFLGLVLYLSPTTPHDAEAKTSALTSHCLQNQCTTNCTNLHFINNP